MPTFTPKNVLPSIHSMADSIQDWESINTYGFMQELLNNFAHQPRVAGRSINEHLLTKMMITHVNFQLGAEADFVSVANECFSFLMTFAAQDIENTREGQSTATVVVALCCRLRSLGFFTHDQVIENLASFCDLMREGEAANTYDIDTVTALLPTLAYARELSFENN